MTEAHSPGSARSCSRAASSSSSSSSATPGGSRVLARRGTTGPTSREAGRRELAVADVGQRGRGHATHLRAAWRCREANVPPRWREAGQSSSGDSEAPAETRGGAPRPLRPPARVARQVAACAHRAAAVAAFDPADDASWERLEEALIYADVGVRATAELIRRLEARQDLSELTSALAEEIASLFGEPPTLDVAARARGDPRRRRQRHRQDDDDRQAREASCASTAAR